jgi:hypothetical protein
VWPHSHSRSQWDDTPQARQSESATRRDREESKTTLTMPIAGRFRPTASPASGLSIPHLEGRLLHCAWSLAIVLAACVAPARSFDAYEGKAVATAREAVSAVQTARLAALAAGQGKAFGPSTSVAIADAEQDALGAQGAFDSIQPPDPAADRLRDTLDELLTAALSGISKLRISARRNELERLPAVAVPLGRVADALDRFIQDHS